MKQENRREFIRKNGKRTAGLWAGALVLAKGKKAVSANDKVILGAIGLGGRGQSLVRGFALRKDVQFAGLCDPDLRRPKQLFEMLKSEHNPDLTLTDDYRRIIDNKEIDAVVVATPDHWHAIPTITACQAGKDVYVEKPASHNIWEGRKMLQAARKYNRVVQVGMQTRSAPYAQKALEYIRSGQLGPIHYCKIFNMKSGSPYKEGAVGPIPKEMNWDLWLGPASMREYRDGIARGGWLYYWDYCGGDFGNDSIHQIDLARMLIGKDYAKSVHCTGGNLAFNDDREVPDTQAATFKFDDMVVTFDLTQWAPYMAKIPMAMRESDQFPYWPQSATRVELYGEKGLMIVGRHGGGWQVFTNDGKVTAQEYGRFPDDIHKENFIQCIRSRERPNADIEEGHRSAILFHMGNISYRIGERKLLFDPNAERFIGDDDANRLLKRDYREPYVIPDNV
ncbi:MAG: Gfo/Idh/MocA family oxidoreductase [Candidatus Omnitrophica bacterium]|nr:Gfo/Idh/MocA family oxidoreductase [Candidatus Omnitrophota bacterium]